MGPLLGQSGSGGARHRRPTREAPGSTTRRAARPPPETRDPRSGLFFVISHSLTQLHPPTSSSLPAPTRSKKRRPSSAPWCRCAFVCGVCVRDLTQRGWERLYEVDVAYRQHYASWKSRRLKMKSQVWVLVAGLRECRGTIATVRPSDHELSVFQVDVGRADGQLAEADPEELERVDRQMPAAWVDAFAAAAGLVSHQPGQHRHAVRATDEPAHAPLSRSAHRLLRATPPA